MKQSTEKLIKELDEELMFGKYDSNPMKTFTKPAPRVYFARTFVGNDKVGGDGILTIYELMKKIGYDEYYQTLVESMKRRVANNPDAVAIVQNDMSHDEITNKNKNTQKLLAFGILEDGKLVYNGGVLFHRGEMSFHT